MGKSFRKTDIAGACGGSDKKDKRFANRRLRKREKEAIRKGKEIPLLREVSDEYTFTKDGKYYFGDLKNRKDELWQKIYRREKGK